MLLWLLFALAPSIAAVEKTHGVSPDLLPRYTPLSSGTWKCLDGSREIPWAAVNDDYCDCTDGSDEPGTSACPNGVFYCRNEGHFGATIRSSRVNDGLCEPECCDGSDERPGMCGNRCTEIGEWYRKARDDERKLRKTGSKIRATYIVFAQKEKKRLEALVQASTKEIAVRENEVARLKDIAERAESLSATALAHKQESPLYKSLITHSMALKSLQREHKKHLEREKALGDILDALRSGYNPNYQDMAVLEAVRGWEFHAGLAPVGQEEGSDKKGPEPEELEQGAWSADKLDKDLDKLLDSDHVSLLLEHEEHIRSPPSHSPLFELSAYLPDFVIPVYDQAKSDVLSVLEMLGIIKGVTDHNADSSRARQAFNDAEHGLKITREEKDKAERDLDELFTVFGAQGEWKKLDGTCLELDSGEYIYEVCMFDEVKQKPKKGGSSFSLGRFDSWLDPSPSESYSTQLYTQGAKCWNGPHRSVDLVLSCGIQNTLLTVAELEKCEYQITGTTPALCLPLDTTTRDEL